ncbi:MAG TPA: PEGA domain-containing protein, partial [Chthoniobacteraceae bacterium]|nr:PEGA domain-containing protein [Chthoniobacteraceae bacterium]
MRNIIPYRLAALGAALLALAACHKSGVPSPKDRTVTIESDPPGCDVYLDGALLGTTPCTMNEVRLNELGLKWPEYIHKDDALSMTWAWDNTGLI